uniref:ULP_PROTEASE domain-containing protein n=1 Tax=Caenorhabditis tropicalis TaxID=1561998 RepID=A0A1I7U1M3_9PELO
MGTWRHESHSTLSLDTQLILDEIYLKNDGDVPQTKEVLLNMKVEERTRKSWVKGRKALEETVSDPLGSLVRKHKIETNSNYEGLVYKRAFPEELNKEIYEICFKSNYQTLQQEKVEELSMKYDLTTTQRKYEEDKNYKRHPARALSVSPPPVQRRLPVNLTPISRTLPIIPSRVSRSSSISTATPLTSVFPTNSQIIARTEPSTSSFPASSDPPTFPVNEKLSATAILTVSKQLDLADLMPRLNWDEDNHEEIVPVRVDESDDDSLPMETIPYFCPPSTSAEKDVPSILLSTDSLTDNEKVAQETSISFFEKRMQKYEGVELNEKMIDSIIKNSFVRHRETTQLHIKKAKSFKRWTRCHSVPVAVKREKDREIAMEEDFYEILPADRDMFSRNGNILVPFWQPPHLILGLVINPRGSLEESKSNLCRVLFFDPLQNFMTAAEKEHNDKFYAHVGILITTWLEKCGDDKGLVSSKKINFERIKNVPAQYKGDDRKLKTADFIEVVVWNIPDLALQIKEHRAVEWNIDLPEENGPVNDNESIDGEDEYADSEDEPTACTHYSELEDRLNFNNWERVASYQSLPQEEENIDVQTEDPGTIIQPPVLQIISLDEEEPELEEYEDVIEEDDEIQVLEVKMGSKPKLDFLKLRNEDKTSCFLNSALNMMYSCEQLRQVAMQVNVHEMPATNIGEIQLKLITSIFQGENSAASLRKTMREFKTEQQDAGSALDYLFQNIMKVEDFPSIEIVMAQHTECSGCGFRKDRAPRKYPFARIALSLEQTFEECWNEKLQPVSRNCTRCTSEASVSSQIKQTGQYLFVLVDQKDPEVFAQFRNFDRTARIRMAECLWETIAYTQFLSYGKKMATINRGCVTNINDGCVSMITMPRTRMRLCQAILLSKLLFSEKFKRS